MNDTDRAILAIASPQRWLATREQLRSAGVSDPAIARRRRSGVLVAAQPGALRLGVVPPTLEQGLLAACLAAGEGAVVSHRSAAWLWGVDRLDIACVEISVPRPRQPRLGGVIVHRSGDLRDADVGCQQGIPVTTPARALLDLGAVARRGLVERALEAWLIEGLVDGNALRQLLATAGRPGRPGTAALRWALDRQRLVDGDPDSRGETRLALLVARHGVPAPVHHLLVAAGGERFELDVAHPELRAAVEIDGRTVHARMATADEDRRRQHALEDGGWRFRRYPLRQVDAAPARVAADLRRWRVRLEGAGGRAA
ncbi:MAG: hypothetical protein IPM45_14230 [Acidimicrobiales bacterium]|nr:hypothetical protein [Acidimicrobiales bacterium]